MNYIELPVNLFVKNNMLQILLSDWHPQAIIQYNPLIMNQIYPLVN